MKQIFTERGDASSLVERALEQAPTLIDAFRVLLRARAAEQHLTKTDLIADGRSTRTWANHLAGRAMSVASYTGYRNQLAATPREKAILDQLYAVYSPTPQRRRVSLRQMMKNAGVDEAELREVQGFRRLVTRTIDGRFVDLTATEVSDRIAVVAKFLHRTVKPRTNPMGVRMTLLAFAVHSAAYAKTNASLQAEAQRILSRVDYKRGDPLYHYISEAIRLYWVNRQDRSINSADGLTESESQFVIHGFGKLQDYATKIEKHSVNEYGVIIGDIGDIMDYNRSSLLLEIDAGNRPHHARIIDLLVRKEEGAGLPLTSTVYGVLSKTEVAIRQGDLAQADELSRTALTSWIALGRKEAFQEKQILMKRVRIGAAARHAKAASAKPYEIAADALDRLEAIDDGTLASELATARILLDL